MSHADWAEGKGSFTAISQLLSSSGKVGGLHIIAQRVAGGESLKTVVIFKGRGA